MRGKDDQQLDVFSYISPEERVPLTILCVRCASSQLLGISCCHPHRGYFLSKDYILAIPTAGTDRGWKREDLYNRGLAD